MKIRLNGNDHELDGPMTIRSLLERLEIDNPAIAVALNRSVIPREEHGRAQISEGDEVEIVRAVGGG